VSFPFFALKLPVFKGIVSRNGVSTVAIGGYPFRPKQSAPYGEQGTVDVKWLILDSTQL
jgi:hypothetical protein